MLTPTEIRSGLHGAVRLLLMDRSGLKSFDFSADGFYRSFLVFLLLLVPLITATATDISLTTSTDPVHYTVSEPIVHVVQMAAYLSSWIVFPAVLALLVRPLGLEARFTAMIVTRNWSSAIGILAYFVPMLLYLVGVLSVEDVSLALLSAFMFNLVYGVIVYRLASDAPVGIAIAIAVLDIAITIVIGTMLDRLITA